MRRCCIAVALSLVVGSAVQTGASSLRPRQDKEEDDNKGLTLRACGTDEVSFDQQTDKKQHPTPQPTPGQALVFVVRPTGLGGKIQTKVAVDGVWMGVNRAKNYFFFALEPGEHYICSKAENRSVVALTVEGGKTYYIQQKIRMGLMKARNTLEVLDEQAGSKALGDSHLSTWSVKAKK